MSVSKKTKSIDDFIGGSPNKLREKYFIKYNLDLYNDIIGYTKKLDLAFKQRIWHWVNGEDNYIYCKECNKNKVSPKMNWRDGYKTYCSNKCSANSDSLRESAKKTLIEKYGVDHYSKTDDYVKKVKETSIDRYGVDNYSKTDDYVSKSKKTYMNRYGVDSYTKTSEYVDKSKKTCLDKYGVDSYVKTEEFKSRFRKTCLEKYGSDHIYKSILYRERFKLCNDENYVSYEDRLNLFKCEKGHDFKITTVNYYGRIVNNIPLCTICNPIGDSRSIKENELFDFIKSNYDGEIVQSYRDGFEIDIYLPELSIGFEFNGLYYHSNKFKEKNYHLSKTNFFKEKEIRIIHIWEDDWSINRSILESQIRNILSLNHNRIYARKCVAMEIFDNKLASSFLDANHIQGNDRSIKKIGLYYEGNLVSIMTFNKSEGRKKMNNDDWNLSRFCNLLNTNIVGGASKLLNYFIKEHSPNRIISYADKDWSIGSLYYTLNFKCVSETPPDYKYIVAGIRRHKQNYTKSILKLGNGITESAYMLDNNIYKVYDCGKMKFELLLNEKTL